MSQTRDEVQKSFLKRFLTYKLWDRDSQVANLSTSILLTTVLVLGWPTGDDPWVQFLWIVLILSFWVDFIYSVWRQVRRRRE